MRRFLFPYLFCSVFLVPGCENSDNESKDHDSMEHTTGVKAIVTSETKAMIDSVRKAQDRVDPSVISFYLTDVRAEMFREQVEKVSGLEKANLMLTYGFEELKAGETEKAIEVFESVLEFVEPVQVEGKEQVIVEIKKLLAVAYLRKGEQENCLKNHNAASCVVPIVGDGRHSLTEGSEKAMLLYLEVLESQPNDLTSKYLLSIAAMTLGKYPDQIPAKYRLPADFFQSPVSFPAFKDVAMSLGLGTRSLAGGVCIEDFDGDGFLDIIASSWGFRDQIHYYRNMGDGTFQDQTDKVGLTGVTGGLNLQHADYNNDGFADFLILRGAWFGGEGRIPNSLMKNNGDGTFTDVTVAAGLYSPAPTQTAVWADFDLDGWIDLFIGNESNPGAEFPCQLFQNLGNGKFQEVLSSAGSNIVAFVKGATAGDINNDGFPDLYLSFLNNANALLLNVTSGGNIGFNNITESAGVGEPNISFPTWMFDYNNDGLLDIFVSAYSDAVEDLPGKILVAYGKKDDPFRPRLYQNRGDGTFTDMSSQMGLVEPAFTMGSNFGDLDNDGYLDFYLGTGEPNLKSIIPNKMYWNREGKSFSDITYAGGFGNIQKGHGVGFGDFDRDGDQDIYIVMGGSFEGDLYQNLFFENPLEGKNNWIVLKLEGEKSNRLAIGARVEIVVLENGKLRNIYNTVSTGSSFGGNSLQLEIGLGKAEKIESMRIYWPAKEVPIQKVAGGLEVNRAYNIKEGQNPVPIDYSAVKLKMSRHSHH